MNRETVPSRTSIYDFDLDPPLTHQGMKDAFQTGTTETMLVEPCFAFRMFVQRERFARRFLLFFAGAPLRSNSDENPRRSAIKSADENSVRSRSTRSRSRSTLFRLVVQRRIGSLRMHRLVSERPAFSDEKRIFGQQISDREELFRRDRIVAVRERSGLLPAKSRRDQIDRRRARTRWKSSDSLRWSDERVSQRLTNRSFRSRAVVGNVHATNLRRSDSRRSPWPRHS